MTSARPSRRRNRWAATREVLFEKFIDPPVLVGPRRWPDETVILDRIHRHLPPRLPELDEALAQSHDVLEVHVDVDHPVRDEERILEPLGEVDRRRPSVRDAVVLRLIQNARGISVVVVRPVGDASQSRTGSEVLWFVEQRHERDEAAIAAAVDTNALGVDPELLLEIIRSVHVVLQVAPAHPPVDRRTPVAAVPRRASVVDVEDDIAL